VTVACLIDGHYRNGSEYIRDLPRRMQERGVDIKVIRSATAYWRR
jgi:Arc/MetJ-type ribon-helix-helix transcriptional regulator